MEMLCLFTETSFVSRISVIINPATVLTLFPVYRQTFQCSKSRNLLSEGATAILNGSETNSKEIARLVEGFRNLNRDMMSLP